MTHKLLFYSCVSFFEGQEEHMVQIHRSTCKTAVRNAHRQTQITLATSQFQCPQHDDMDIAHTPHTSPECLLFQAAPVCYAPTPRSRLNWHFEFSSHCSTKKKMLFASYDLQANRFCCLNVHFCYFRTTLFKIVQTCLVLSSTVTPVTAALAV